MNEVTKQPIGRAILLTGLLAMAVAGCSRDNEPDLVNFRASQSGPDEFAILPTLPLEQPESYASLATPTPGGRNLSDPSPEADAIVALGGRPSVLTRASTDGALINYARRYGASPSIRSVLASEDLEFRRSNRGRVLERLFNVNRYYSAYADQELDQYRELERFRAAGIRTPSVPPEDIEQ